MTLLRDVAAAWWGVVGLALGSFLTVVIARLPRGESLWWPPSHCPLCGVRLGPKELIPIGSFLVQRGRCRHCHGPIPLWYPLTELTAGAGCAGLAYAFFPRPQLYPALVLWLVGIVASVVDARHRIIPNRLLAAGLVALSAALAPSGLLAYVRAAEGAALFVVVAGLIRVLSRGGLGMGDVKYLCLVGAGLGPWQGLVALYGAVVTAGIYGLALILTRRARKQDRMAFGPFIALGSAVGILLGPAVVAWYRGLLG
jgi:leader peptidase (prepilin peptidase)/N-methyltransferase